MSLFDQVAGIFNPQATKYTFYIYTNEVLNNPTDDVNKLANIAIQFNTLHDLTYKNIVNIAYEPLENSQFASDSIQNNPYTLMLTGIVAPISQGFTYTNEDYRNELNKTVEQLKTYLQNTTLLTILKEKPLFDQYSNLKMTSFTYDINPEYNNLVAYCTFQEIRIVTSSQYGSLSQDQVANPANASQVNDGIQNPQEPTSTGVADAGGSNAA